MRLLALIAISIQNGRIVWLSPFINKSVLLLFCFWPRSCYLSLRLAFDENFSEILWSIFLMAECIKNKEKFLAKKRK